MNHVTYWGLQDALINKRSINGLKVGEKLAYQALYDLYGEMQVKNFCSHFLSEAITVRLSISLVQWFINCSYIYLCLECFE